MKYGYYPGCSLERNAIAYHTSTMMVSKSLGIEFKELEDWNCCGATEYIAVNRIAAYALVTRNLALAASQPEVNNQLIAPCSACFLNLNKVEQYLRVSHELMETVNLALAEGGLSYKAGNLRIRHLLDIIVNDIGYPAISAHVINSLKGLRVAPYYGCLVVRPSFSGVFDDHEYPTSMDILLETLGAEVVDFPLKTHCCGGHMTQISEAVAFELIRQLLKNAADYEADVIVTLCPMCQLNLDVYQADVNKRFNTNYHIPVLYFTQLLGLSFGYLPEELGIGKEFIDARQALAKIGTAPQTPESTAVKKPSKEALPMPIRRKVK